MANIEEKKENESTAQTEKSSKSKDWEGILALVALIVLVVDILLFVFTLVEVIRSTDYSLSMKDGLQFFRNDVGYSEERMDCYYPGCREYADEALSCGLYYKKSPKLVAKMENKAGFLIETKSVTIKETSKGTFTDDYLTFTPVGNSVRVDEHHDVYEYTYNSGSHEITYAHVAGLYCEKHADLAIKTAEEEYKDAIRHNFTYRWGSLFFPWNVILMGALFVLAILVLKSSVDDSGKVKRIVIVGLFAACIIGLICMAVVPLGSSSKRSSDAGADYEKAIGMMESADYSGAYEIFNQLGEYKKSADYATTCSAASELQIVEEGRKEITIYQIKDDLSYLDNDGLMDTFPELRDAVALAESYYGTQWDGDSYVDSVSKYEFLVSLNIDAYGKITYYSTRADGYMGAVEEGRYTFYYIDGELCAVDDRYPDYENPEIHFFDDHIEFALFGDKNPFILTKTK